MSIKQKIGIIGGGIVGSTAAFYLSNESDIEITLFDNGVGQASSAAAGIISPWLSQRRNKEWYFLAREGAKFYNDYMHDLSLFFNIHEIYKKTGTLLYKKTPRLLDKLEKIAYERRIEAPEIGEISRLTAKEIKQRFPFITSDEEALYITGGAKIDGANLIHYIHQFLAKKNQLLQTTIKKMDYINQQWIVSTEDEDLIFDQLIIAVGAWLPELLSPLGYEVDIRPQKGQLIEVQSTWDTDQLPVIMPVGESDIIPFQSGKILIGATHENEEGFNLTPDTYLLDSLKQSASGTMSWLNELDISQHRVGTRAYTSDFLPFFGEVNGLNNLYVASGLGSSGLTTGPIIGKTMVDWILNKETIFENYRNQPNNYITKK